MDPGPFNPAATAMLTLTFVLVLLAGLHSYARQRGASLFRNLGPEGWVIAFLVVFAAGLFGNLVMSAMTAPYPILLIVGPVYGALGSLAYYGAWRTLDRAIFERLGLKSQKG